MLMSSQSDALKIDIVVNNMTNANSYIPVAMLQLTCHFDGIKVTSTQKKEKDRYLIFLKWLFSSLKSCFFWENGTLEKYYVMVNSLDLT